MKIEAYVICFKENIERRKFLVKRFKSIGLNPVFIDAVRGSALSEDEKAPFVHSGRQYLSAHVMQENAIGCALSHFRAWDALLASDAPYALIFEDDAEPLTPDVLTHIKSLVEMADRLDVVILSNRRKKLRRFKVKDLNDGAGLYVLRHNDFGAESYFITRDAARKFITHPRRFAFEVDFLIHHWWYHDCHILHLLPSLFAEDGRTSTIGYTNLENWTNDTVRHWLSRRLVRAGDSVKKRFFFPSYLNRIRERLATSRSEAVSSEDPSPRLLIIQPMVGIGDMVWHKPWLDAVMESRMFRAVLMAKPSAQAEMVLAEHGGLEIVPLFRSQRGKKGRHDGIFGFFRMVWALVSVEADEVWILHRSWRYAAAAWLAGISSRSGYGLGKQSWFLNTGAGLEASYRRAHPRDAASAFFTRKGIVPQDTHPRLVPSDTARAGAAGLLKNAGPLVIFGVGAADAPRRWSPQHFASLADQISARVPQLTIALCGSPAESEIGEEILRLLSPETPKPMLIFDQSVATVIALHAAARLYIGNDTSLINIAAAVGTPAVRIFASTLAVLDSPLIKTVLPADKTRLDIPGSIDDIRPDEVMAEAVRELKAAGLSPSARLSKSEKRRKTGE